MTQNFQLLNQFLNGIRVVHLGEFSATVQFIKEAKSNADSDTPNN